MTSATAGVFLAAAPRPADPQRLRSSGAVRAVFAARRASASDLAVVHVRNRDDDGPARYTVVAGKQVGNAVQRNRVKRRLRAVVQTLPLAPGADYVIVGRPQALSVPGGALHAALSRQVAAVSSTR